MLSAIRARGGVVPLTLTRVKLAAHPHQMACDDLGASGLSKHFEDFVDHSRASDVASLAVCSHRTFKCYRRCVI
jgi:hypothetical protein